MDGIIDRLDGWLSKRTPPAVAVICLLLVALLGILDLATGHELSSFVFYFVPIAIAAEYAGRRLGLIISAASAAAWLSADLTAGQAYSHPAIHIWNVGVRFAAFVVVTHLVATLALARTRATLAAIDPVTGLMNRRAFNEGAGRLLELARRHGHHTSVAYIDVDDLKHVNDTFGHDHGDRLLRQVGESLARAIRSSDLVGRHGGDEFVLLLPETDYEGAQGCVKTIRDCLPKARDGKGGPLACSIGVATFQTPPATLGKAIKAADALMYIAKKRGKNRVVHEIVDVAGEARKR